MKSNFVDPGQMTTKWSSESRDELHFNARSLKIDEFELL